MKTHEFEVVVSVANYMPSVENRNDESESEAFENAAADDEAAKDQAELGLIDFFGDNFIKIKITGIKFVEFDAENWSHAGAIWEVSIKGPNKLMDKFIKKYEEI